jgi:hypothetical protein
MQRHCRLPVSLFSLRQICGVGIPVNTNWPTVAANPARNALNGYHPVLAWGERERGRWKYVVSGENTVGELDDAGNY